VSGHRSFVAITLPPHVVDALLDIGEELRRVAPRWQDQKWVAENNLHITLKFLGNLETDGLHALRSDLGRAMARVSAFSLRLEGVRGVSSHGRRSMVWATFDDPEGKCEALASAVEQVAAVHGVDLDGRPFTPHVTLVRARKPLPLPSEALTSTNTELVARDISMSVPSATLFTSTLTRTQPVYEEVQTWLFARSE
jgi:RNA 2',3'-cyclic 3'-phosphodiesterase